MRANALFVQIRIYSKRQTFMRRLYLFDISKFQQFRETSKLSFAKVKWGGDNTETNIQFGYGMLMGLF